MRPVSSKTFWQTYFAFGILIGLIALIQTVVRVSAMDISLWHSKWTILFLGYAATVVASVVLLYGLQTGRSKGFFERLENIKPDIGWRGLAVLSSIALAFVPPLAKV